MWFYFLAYESIIAVNLSQILFAIFLVWSLATIPCACGVSVD